MSTSRIRFIRWVSALCLCSLSLTSRATVDDFEAWLANEQMTAAERLNANISAAGTHRGVILASPSHADPNYYFYWVRDGAMVMRAVFDRYMAGDALAASELKDYVSFTKQNQLVVETMPAGLGEPRFNVDGSVNQEPWGRPQNDGPALRALVLIRYARVLLSSGDRASVERDLYFAEMPARTVIKTDLEFIAHHWQDRCIDLWEEAMGHHFFTEAAQMAALREGARLAADMGDASAAAFYSNTASQIEIQLTKHWDNSKDYYLSALDYSGGPAHQKPSQLDVSVLLAALFDEQSTGLLSVADDHIIKTSQAIETMFDRIYTLNADRGELGTSIGRYQEDDYFGGNPWVLTTAAFAEWHYRMAAKIAGAGSFVLTTTQANYLASVVRTASKTPTANASLVGNLDLASLSATALRNDVIEALRLRGDSYLQRVRLSAGLTGQFSEQFDRSTGSMLSAVDLSWSYAAFLRASEARAEVTALEAM